MKITIHKSCDTTPKHPKIGPKDDLQFQCDALQIFAVNLPGGVFIGYPDNFSLPVAGPFLFPVSPLQPVPGTKARIANYIYDVLGQNCTQLRKKHRKKKKKAVSKTRLDVPPDIIIES